MADQPSTDAAAEDFSSERRGKVPTRPRVGTALIETSTGGLKALQYVDVGGVAVVEGDIALGPVDEVDTATQQAREAPEGTARAVAISGTQFRWTGCTVPFEIDPALPNQARVTDALQHWRDNTGLNFVERTTQANWIYFTDDDGCWSFVGMRGGRQTISVGAGCSTGNTIHEIGHAIGLWHEQSREDRDTFVDIQWANIQTGMETQFSQHIADGDDIGAYDYGSIMHYPRKAFSKNGNDTIVPVDPTAQIGQRTALSPLDRSAVAALYPTCHRIVKQPWREPVVVKKLRDTQVFKKVVDDDRYLKPIRDLQKPPRDPGPIKLDVPHTLGSGLTRPPVGGGALRPFALETPHHAELGMSAEESQLAGLADTAAALQAQLLEVEAALARAQATASESALEVTQLQQLKEAVQSAYLDAVDQLPGQG